jgi:dihydrofolate reductase
VLIYSLSVSADGFITDRDGAIGWTVPSDEQFQFHLERVAELGAHLCGRRLYETMLVWETEPSLRANPAGAAFPDLWCALPKIVFSRALAIARAATDKDIEIGGAGLAAQAIELDLVDELRMFRNPVLLGGGTPFLPPLGEQVTLELVETKTFAPRVVYERYRRVRDRSGT